MAEINITYHLQNIFKSGELNKDSVTQKIRASERRFYQKITDIYKECSYDYDKNSETTKEFYKNVQNKLCFAITGMTASEIIYNRVDSKKDYMGLKTWLSCIK